MQSPGSARPACLRRKSRSDRPQPSDASTAARADLGLHRAGRPLQPRRRGVAVEPDDQPVARHLRLPQQRDMTGMQQVEAAVGESRSSAPGGASARPGRARPAAASPCRRCRGSRPSSQAPSSLGVDNRGADLADDDAGGDVGEARRVARADAGADAAPNAATDRVAGTGDIVDLAHFRALRDATTPSAPTSTIPSWPSETRTAAKSAALDQRARGGDDFVARRRPACQWRAPARGGSASADRHRDNEYDRRPSGRRRRRRRPRAPRG